MVKPLVPHVRAGEAMAERAARDGTALTTMARDFAALQLWITDTCS